MSAPTASSAAQLEFRFLGELELLRGGEPQVLPPSKKTRALLAYLVLNARPHRREALCELLWDVTDDPRGALRWSLSRLRKLVDDAETKRLQADRERVSFVPKGATVDLLDMRKALTSPAPTALEVSELENWAERCSREALEGLDLPDFDAYQAWLVAEREAVRILRANVLAALVERLGSTPARAVLFARTWCRVDPMNSDARLALLRMGLRAGQPQEAQRDYQAARRLFAELDPQKERALTVAWQELRSSTHTVTDNRERPSVEAAAKAVALPPSPAPPAQVLYDPTADAAVGLLPLTGREEERQLLMSALAEVGTKRRARLLIATGEAGIGKTRLLCELWTQVRAAGHQVLLGEAHEGEAGRPYGPWIDALRRLPTNTLDAASTAALDPLLNPQHAAEASSREALFAGVVTTLSNLTAAGERPLLVVLEDVHWLDEGSAELLHYVVRMLKQAPLLFVLSARTAELSDNNPVLRVLRSVRRDVEQSDLPLAPLPKEHISTLVAHVNDGLDSAAIHERCGGNALYALELARAGNNAISEGSLADAVRERVERLAPEAADLLRWCAVLGAAFAPAQLQEVSSLTASAQLLALEALEQHALLRAKGAGYVFAHDVVRQVVYGGLSQPRRVLMHRCAAEALRRLQAADRAVDQAVVADIARHAAAAGEHALAATAYLQAGQRCLQLAAFENAASLARRGIRHAETMQDPSRVQALLELHDILLWARRPADGERFCIKVQELAESALAHGCLEHARLGFMMQSYMRWDRGEWSDARQQMAMAEAAVRDSTGQERVEALAQAARCEALLEHDMSLAESYLREAQAAVTPPAQPPFALVDAEALLQRFVGNVDGAHALFRRARMIARVGRDRYGELQALLSNCELLYDAGRYDTALALTGEAVALAERSRDGSEGPYASLLRSLAGLALGDNVGEMDLRQYLNALDDLDAKHRLTFGLNRSAQRLRIAGDLHAALALSRQALQLAGLLEWPSEQVIARVTLGLTQQTSADAAEVAANREQATQIAPTRLSAYARSVLASWLQEDRANASPDD